MTEHRFTFNDQEADLLAEVLSHSLRGLPMRFTPENRAYLINLKSALVRRSPGRRPTTALVETTESARLEEVWRQ